MAIFNCKMCGAPLDIEGSSSVIECGNCGTTQTIPNLESEKRANLYDRASHYRRNNDFDKAASIYDQLVAEDSADAEAYWSLVLCRYGIEYVEDPRTHKRIPTVNRAQFTSIFDDDNYKLALSNANDEQKGIYQAEAKAIDEIQKGILEISKKEKPFDVFICYKETDENGKRTRDSVLANELYHQLTEEGFKVFFSRITLEDKLGSEYEPYIFAALNSAKVMVVIGTDAKYYSAPWVKNEWSRYLALIRNGAKKTLVPAYRDIDPYDLPEEFSHLQALDMSKLGFMQDLIRGIKKIIGTEKEKAEHTEKKLEADDKTSAKIKKACRYLEDREYDKAVNIFQAIIEEYPDNEIVQNKLGYCYENGFGVDKNYEQAYRWYKRSAEQGNAEAQNSLGSCFYNGQGVAQNFNKAVEWYQKAADQGNSEAQKNLGNCYSEGKGFTRDVNKAIEWYLKAAENGNAKAQNNLGNCYFYGEGVEKDHSKAVEWYKKAASNGSVGSQINLGDCYYYGEGVKKNYSEAVKWYRKAAEQENPVALLKLGDCYYNGNGVLQDSEKAVELYSKAAEQGNLDVQYKLGECYYYGRGVGQDYSKAFEWYSEAAEQGDDDAQYKLGDCYYYGHGVGQDYSKAFKLYSKAAEQWNTDAQCKLGDLYYNGEVIGQDYSKAFEWYSEAAEQGDDDAQCKLGDCYYYGYGVGQDYSKAFEWYSEAAEQGNTDVQCKLGDCYYYGHGVGQDYSKAFEWYSKAAEQGNTDVQCKLGDLYYDGEGVGQDYSKAFKWYSKAAEQWNTDAQCKLGDLYYDGEGVGQDYSKAFEWYSKAANYGSGLAKFRLGICHEDGRGVPQDFSHALKWYTEALISGEVDKKMCNERIYEIKYLIAIDREHSAKTLEEYNSVLQLFDNLSGYKDSDAQKKKCLSDMQKIECKIKKEEQKQEQNKKRQEKKDNKEQRRAQREQEGGTVRFAILQLLEILLGVIFCICFSKGEGRIYNFYAPFGFVVVSIINLFFSCRIYQSFYGNETAFQFGLVQFLEMVLCVFIFMIDQEVGVNLVPIIVLTAYFFIFSVIVVLCDDMFDIEYFIISIVFSIICILVYFLRDVYLGYSNFSKILNYIFAFVFSPIRLLFDSGNGSFEFAEILHSAYFMLLTVITFKKSR